MIGRQKGRKYMIPQTGKKVKRSQKSKVFDYLDRFGSITPLEAFENFAITRLGARIYDLRQLGIVIDTVIERGFNRFGEPIKFARYFLRRDA